MAGTSNVEKINNTKASLVPCHLIPVMYQDCLSNGIECKGYEKALSICRKATNNSSNKQDSQPASVHVPRHLVLNSLSFCLSNELNDVEGMNGCWKAYHKYLDVV